MIKPYINAEAFHQSFGQPLSGYSKLTPECLAKDFRVPTTLSALTPDFVEVLQDEGAVTDIVNECLNWMAKGDYHQVGTHFCHRLAQVIANTHGKDVIEAGIDRAETIRFQNEQDEGCEYDPETHEAAA